MKIDTDQSEFGFCKIKLLPLDFEKLTDLKIRRIYLPAGGIHGILTHL